jgi:large subunit ribosomal protein L5
MTETEMTEQEPTMTDEPTIDEPTTDEPTAAAEAEAPMAEAPETEAATEAPTADAAVAEAAAEAPARAARGKAAAPKTGKAPKTAAPSDAPEAQAEPAPPAMPAEAAAALADAPAAPAAARAAGPRGLRAKYHADVVPALVKQFEYANPNQVPKLEKIVVNVGLGEALTNAKAIDAASGDLTLITGQKPIVMKARRSIAQFKIRTGNPIGLKVTLRGQRMWDFLERLTLLTLPRIRDFRGIPSRSFDGRGNYTLGMREQIAFPEIDYDKVDRLRGLEISVVTTAKTDEESKRMLELLGMPFAS